MSAERLAGSGAIIRPELRVSATGVEHPCLPPIRQADIEKLPELLPVTAVEHRSDYLDAFGQIPYHPVGRANKELALGWILLAIREMENARMLQEPADDRPDADVFRLPGHTWTKTTKTADDQINRHAGGRGPAQGFDNIRVFQLIHFGDDAGRAACALVFGLALDQLEKPGTHCC